MPGTGAGRVDRRAGAVGVLVATVGDSWSPCLTSMESIQSGSRSGGGEPTLPAGRPPVRQDRRRRRDRSPRAVLSGEATAVPKSHDGPVEALRALKLVQRSASEARTQALNQLQAIELTAPEDLRERLPGANRRQLLTTCAAFRVRAEDDSLAAMMRLATRERTQRVVFLDAQVADVRDRMRRITTATAPALVAKHGVGPDAAATLLITAGDNPDWLGHEKSVAALVGNPSW